MSRSRAVLGLLGVSGFCVRLSGERRSLCENQRDKDKDKEKDGESSESEGVLARAWQVIAEVSSPLGDLPSLESASASVYHVIESGAAGKIGYGFIMGYSSGFCLKRVSRMSAFVVGGAFIGLQSLSYHGYVVVNHEKLKKDLENMLDLDKDGDIDKDDAKVAFNRMSEILSYNLPTGGGFAAGLVLGLRS